MRLKWKLQHMQGMDWIWLAVLLLNLYGLSRASMNHDWGGMIISGLFVGLSLRGMF